MGNEQVLSCILVELQAQTQIKLAQEMYLANDGLSDDQYFRRLILIDEMRANNYRHLGLTVKKVREGEENSINQG